MWYFTWLLGLGFALGCGVINAMWLEANFAFGERDARVTERRFAEHARAKPGRGNELATDGPPGRIHG